MTLIDYRIRQYSPQAWGKSTLNTLSKIILRDSGVWVNPSSWDMAIFYIAEQQWKFFTNGKECFPIHRTTIQTIHNQLTQCKEK